MKDGSTKEIKKCWETAFHNFYFPKCSVSTSQTSVDKIGKLELIEKITLYVISQG